MNKRQMWISGLMFLLTVIPVSAQSESDAVGDTPHPGVLQPTRFIDNWYIEAGGGAQLLFSDDASRLGLKDRISPAVSLTLGKWLSPCWGLRLQGGGYELYGYNGIKGNYIGDPLPGLGGAFGTDDPVKDHVSVHPDGTYRHNVRYVNVHADFQVSLANLFGGYKPGRRWDLIPAAGLGYTRVLSYKGTPSAHVMSAHFALMGKVRLSSYLDLNLEASTAVMPDRFDGRISGGKPYAETAALTLGLTCRLGKPKFKSVQCDYYGQVKEMQRKLQLQEKQSQEELKKAQREIKLWKHRAEHKPVTVDTVKTAWPTHLVLHAIQFSLKNTVVNEEKNEPEMAHVAEFLKQNKDTKVILKGYADKETGGAKLNQMIADKRVASVADYLVKKHGVDAKQLILKSYGDKEQPYEKHEWNRAVIIEVAQP